MVLFAATFVIGCGSSYRFIRYKNRGENAIRKKDYSKAKEIYSYIYKQEKEASPQVSENIAWAYYRLGVIHELMGDCRLAKGYYWGDSVEEGFYASEPDIEWYAKTGWKWLDQNNPPRSLKEILELEMRKRPSGEKVIRSKKKVAVKKDTYKPMEFKNSGRPTRIFNRSLTPPPPDTPEPFRVLY
ncbi:MAG: hypothetical protein Kow0029_10180 [Candidatus Rifleibacteriota bacterium]